MNYIKTYELFNNFSFFKKKKDPFSTPDLKYVVEESLIELTDLGFNVKVEVKMNRIRNGEGNPISSNPEVRIEIAKIDESVLPSYTKFHVNEVVEVLNFTLPFLQKEYGLELWDLTYREIEWTRRGNSGTKKKHSYTKLKRIKDMETNHIDIILKDRKF